MGEEPEKCVICLGDMEVVVYREPPNDHSEPVVEGDCTRMSCGHALHTVCLVNSLISTQGKCVCCNIRNFNLEDNVHLGWEERLQFEKLCFDKIHNIKRETKIKEGLKKYKDLKKELQEKHKIFSKKVNDFKKSLRDDMKIDDAIKQTRSIRRATTNNFNKEILKSKGLEVAAVSHLTQWSIDKWLYNETSYNARRLMLRGFRDGFY
jgi:hypothetical protein